MKKQIAVVLAAVMVLSSCGTINKKTLGLEKQAPNEFLVTTKAPLTMPPGADINPVSKPVSVQPQIVLNDVSKDEASFASKFEEQPTISARIDEISNAIDKELQRFKRNG